MIRKKKKFAWPKKLYDKPRILDENRLVKKYGLKNKKEIWKVEAKVNYFRSRAKALITAEAEEQQKFFAKLNEIGLNVKTIADVLALNKEDLLKRRLPSIMVTKKKAQTPQEARQMVVHKRVMIDGKVVNVPSYFVGVDEEDSIILKVKTRKPAAVPVENQSETEEITNE